MYSTAFIKSGCHWEREKKNKTEWIPLRNNEVGRVFGFDWDHKWKSEMMGDSLCYHPNTIDRTVHFAMLHFHICQMLSFGRLRWKKNPPATHSTFHFSVSMCINLCIHCRRRGVINRSSIHHIVIHTWKNIYQFN